MTEGRNHRVYVCVCIVCEAKQTERAYIMTEVDGKAEATREYQHKPAQQSFIQSTTQQQQQKQKADQKSGVEKSLGMTPR